MEFNIKTRLAHAWMALFRHTLATLMLQRGTQITEVQRILGHVNINTTMIYAKVSDEDVKEGNR